MEAANNSLASGFAIYSVKVYYSQGEPQIQICLDKLTDKYGSPSIADCEQFSHILGLKLQALSELKEIPENYSLEVSSPGAERKIKIPDELARFRDIPMRVKLKNNEARLKYPVLQLVKNDEHTSTWNFAEVKLNKKAGYNVKKKPEDAIILALNEIQEVNLHLDF